MAYTDYAGWLAFYHREGYDPGRMDLRFAKLMALVAQLGGNKKAKPSDFYPNLKPPVEYESNEVIDKKLGAMIPKV